MFIVSGVIKIAAAVLICVWPMEDFTPLIYLFGVPAVLQGSSYMFFALNQRVNYVQWGALLILGIVYFLPGVLLIVYPNVTPEFLMIAVAATWSLVGLMLILFSIQLNKESQSEVGLLLSGTLSILAGVYMVTNLDRTVYSLLWIIVIYSILIGILHITFGIKAKGWRRFNFDN